MERLDFIGGKHLPQKFSSLAGKGDWNTIWGGDWFVCDNRLWNKTGAGKAIGGWAAFMRDGKVVFSVGSLPVVEGDETEVVHGLSERHFDGGTIFINAEIAPDAECRRADLSLADGGFTFVPHQEGGQVVAKTH